MKKSKVKYKIKIGIHKSGDVVEYPKELAEKIILKGFATSVKEKEKVKDPIDKEEK